MWPVTLHQMKRLQIECTSYCNAFCPSCEREKYPYENPIYNRPLNTHYLSIKNFVEWFDFESYKNLEQIHFCGNIDEPTLNSDLIDILNYIRNDNDAKIFISTNGATKNKTFWKKLAQIKNVIVVFGIDGLEDTNHIYRKNVKWKKLMSNVDAFLNAGGIGAWQFIVFEHNEHQIEKAKKISEDMGFFTFIEVNSRRPNKEVIEIKIEKREESNCVKCKATYDNRDLGVGFYIDVRGNVWPCCWMGTTEMSNDIAKKIGKNHGYFLSNNLNFNSFEEIVSSDFFSELYDKQNDIDICNEKCKTNKVDEFDWNLK